ncbi:hypothetical protein [Streptomyces sp. SID8352]|uniref:hypothetical protein n=1 Tax=Streptomyces sp. SID8352 TaxID=2690338 RepID=UPI00136B73A3|nr:hypothetical protein [Streptomyces sp. SID8352]MYU21269.1 hypothetical protein [Streptomyces sp. SID8352]
MSVRKTPETLAELRKEAEEFTRARAGHTSSKNDVARVLELIRAAEVHLDSANESYYLDEGDQIHKAGARAIALRLDRDDPRPMQASSPCYGRRPRWRPAVARTASARRHSCRRRTCCRGCPGRRRPSRGEDGSDGAARARAAWVSGAVTPY